MRRILYSVFLFVIFLLFAFNAHAQQFRDDYNVIYSIKQNKQSIETTVNFTIKITNLLTDVFVEKFSLTFPKTFVINNLTAADDNGPIKAQVNESQNTTEIAVEFSDPKIGQGTINNFFLTFNQSNLFKVNGNVWEVILPTIEDRKSGSYQVEIHLPQQTEKKISIAKPKPSFIQNNVIYWKNPPSKTIYAVFGDLQLYNLDLRYKLQNPKLSRVYTDIAFPPDMLHQKIYVDSISPTPAKTYLDEDGNFMGRYYLNPRENKTVSFKGVVALTVAGRPEVQVFNQNQIEKQKKYLLSQTNYWKVDQIEKYSNLKTSQNIYDFILNNFSYDYQRVSKNVQRLGAEFALKNPTKAICLEFSDAFIALTREKGIYSREIEGYGFSSDSQLRPLSLLTDVLHSWPEYYDQEQQRWMSVDPTWQNTSGIDYFNSFDLNHLAFVIHAKRSDYPLAAGMYKLENSRDVEVKALAAQPSEHTGLAINNVELEQNIDQDKEYKATVAVKNMGNVFQYNVPVLLKAKNLEISTTNFIIDSIAPLEQKNISFSYKSTKEAKNQGAELSMEVRGKQLYSQKLKIRPFFYKFLTEALIFILVLGTIFLAFKVYKKIKKKYEVPR